MSTAKEDAAVLKWAGMMGHEFVGVRGAPGERRKAGEFNSLESARRLVDDPTLTVYSKGLRKKWLCCYDRRSEETAKAVAEINAENLKRV